MSNRDKKHWIETEETARQRINQAKRLKEQARSDGLKFETYLTPDLAEWVLDMVEQGIFIDPGEAVFVFMCEAKDIEPYDDIKSEILKRRLEASLKDIEEGRVYTSEEVFKKIKDKAAKEKTSAAVWMKIQQEPKPESR